MKLFSWFKQKKDEKLPGSKKVEIALFSTEVSKVRCFATDCYFNRSYTGEIACDLKQVDIDKTGRCMNFAERDKTAKFLEQRGKETEK